MLELEGVEGYEYRGNEDVKDMIMMSISLFDQVGCGRPLRVENT
jgi:hypothetical protein